TFFFFSSRRRHTRFSRDWSSDVCSSDLLSLMFEPGDPPETRYNATLLNAVMGNLLRNALHYTEEGFIRLTLTANGFVVEDSGVEIGRASCRERAWIWVGGES